MPAIVYRAHVGTRDIGGCATTVMEVEMAVGDVFVSVRGGSSLCLRGFAGPTFG